MRIHKKCIYFCNYSFEQKRNNFPITKTHFTTTKTNFHNGETLSKRLKLILKMVKLILKTLKLIFSGFRASGHYWILHEKKACFDTNFELP